MMSSALLKISTILLLFLILSTSSFRFQWKKSLRSFQNQNNNNDAKESQSLDHQDTITDERRQELQRSIVDMKDRRREFLQMGKKFSANKDVSLGVGNTNRIKRFFRNTHRKRDGGVARKSCVELCGLYCKVICHYI